MFVCSLCISTPYDQMQPNFLQTPLSTRKRSIATFFPAKIDPSLEKCQPTFLTNQIAVFSSVGELLNSTFLARR